MNLSLKKYSLDKIGNYPFLKFTLIVFIISQLISFTFGLITDLTQINDISLSDKPGIREGNIYFQAIAMVILAPILETIVFQFLPYITLIYFDFLKERKWLVITISALIFGFTHYYSPLYILHTTCLGALFMYVYIMRQQKQDSLAVVCLVHILKNLTAFTLNLYML